MNPLNGSVVMDEAINGSTANYTCIEGYRLNGTETRVCQLSGEWEPDEPSCYGKSQDGVLLLIHLSV